MESKFQSILDGILEAIWLGTIITIPLFFNVYSSRIFEPDKIALLRIFSTISMAVLLVKLIAGGFKPIQVRGSRRKFLSSSLRTPLAVPIIGITVVYIFSTIFSVAPTASFWGSYQRSQGLYTTISYLILFLSLVTIVGSRNQVERIVTVVVMTSLPIALYGIIQKYGLDPVPWEGDVTARIASTLGNSIFVSAFLIMVFPVTLIRIIENFRALISAEKDVFIYIIRASIYLTVACTQVIAIVLSGSRGPMLGLIASLLFIGVLLLIRINKKWIILTFLALGIFFGGFLVLLNIENGPLQAMRESSLVGRFGKLLDPGSNSALVRKYIWEGAVDLITPHEPIGYPDGTEDKFNFLRPIIGYGPETMFVAFNRFYIPELGQVEKRNASPDRAHNESWDALSTTGILGLVAYFLLYSLIFYYALKWLYLITTKKEQKIFLLIYLGIGIITAIVISVWRGIAYLGIGLPIGFVLGLFLYLIYVTLFSTDSGKYKSISWETYLIIGSLLSALIAHFIEINFGIAIVATRMYFWMYVGLLFVIGYKFQKKLFDSSESPDITHLENGSFLSQPITTDFESMNNKRSSRTKTGIRKYKSSENNNSWLRGAVISSLLLSISLSVLAYDLLSNQGGYTSPIQILWASLTEIDRGYSTGILMLLGTTWLLTGIIYSLDIPVHNSGGFPGNKRPYFVVLFVILVSFFISLVFALWHTSGLSKLLFDQVNTLDQLKNQISQYELLISRLLIFIFFIIFCLGYTIGRKPSPTYKNSRIISSKELVSSMILIPVILVAALFINLRNVQADVVYRIGNAFSRPSQWSVAVEIYKRALELMPNEDHYYLSLASAYFEQAKAIDDTLERERLIKQAEADLQKAQSINPLNTDHTANLARLYNLWSSYTEDPGLKQERLLRSSKYYEVALTLSPQNTRLWNEWALLHAFGFKDLPETYKLLNHSLSIDPEYDWTHGLLGDYFVQQADSTQDDVKMREFLEDAEREYSQALTYIKYYEAQYRFSYLRALGSVFARLGKLDDAILTYEKAIKVKNAYDIWRIEDTLARLYYEIGDTEKALAYAESAYGKAPETYKDRVLELLNFLKGDRP